MIRSFLKRLERGARGNLESFVLEDGSPYYYSASGAELYLYACACIRAGAAGEPFPTAPLTIQNLTRAKDRRAAVEQVASGLFPYQTEPLIESGQLVPAEWIKPVEDLPE